MKNLFLSIFLFCTIGVFAQNAEKINYKIKENISYTDISETDAYKKERCKLDVYYPENVKNFPTVVWFHGGGLEVGEKHIPEELKNRGMAVVAVNYRLSPKAENPAYIDDAAASVAWTFENIKSFGGDSNLIYVAGHSAGGYLTLMVGLDKSYLQKYGVDADKIKGLLPISGQTNTHYTIRKERGLPQNLPLVDSFAPLAQAREGIPPMLITTGDRDLEMTARYEENAHLAVILKSFGNKNVVLHEIAGFDHGDVCAPACLLIAKWVKEHSK